MKPKTKQLLSVNNGWLFYRPIKSFVMNGQPNVACLTASHDTETTEIIQREIKSDRARMECLVDKELALSVVWRRVKWYSRDEMCPMWFFSSLPWNFVRRNENVLPASAEARYPASFRRVVCQQIALVGPFLRGLGCTMVPFLDQAWQ